MSFFNNFSPFIEFIKGGDDEPRPSSNFHYSKYANDIREVSQVVALMARVGELLREASKEKNAMFVQIIEEKHRFKGKVVAKDIVLQMSNTKVEFLEEKWSC
ncbi:hypothetical protein V6N13_108916 [Hibiscus sabdariffa]|uniref:Uncharacterized protein n=1 Tax=Hibiscus sabdariffa TaxID=183260 RepID=A0ABR2FNW0_9ROSI